VRALAAKKGGGIFLLLSLSFPEVNHMDKENSEAKGFVKGFGKKMILPCVFVVLIIIGFTPMLTQNFFHHVALSMFYFFLIALITPIVYMINLIVKRGGNREE
jgi:hypothetical protein